jgi:hypothetical protein
MASKVARGGMFVGLVQDLDNQKMLLEDRLETWLRLLSGEFNLTF